MSNLNLKKRGKFSNISILNLIGLVVAAYACYSKSVVLPNTHISRLIVKLFVRNNYISGYKLVVLNKDSSFFGRIYIEAFLSYIKNQPSIYTMQAISLPSRPQYVTISKLQVLLVKNIQNTYIISTSFGLLTGKEAFNMQIGGELLCILA